MAAEAHPCFGKYPVETERLLASNDQKGLCLGPEEQSGLGGATARSEQFIRDEDDTLLRDKVQIGELLDTESLQLDPTIAGLSPTRPHKLSLEHGPSFDDMTFLAIPP